jgi:hypothetical protein
MMHERGSRRRRHLSPLSASSTNGALASGFGRTAIHKVLSAKAMLSSITLTVQTAYLNTQVPSRNRPRSHEGHKVIFVRLRVGTLQVQRDAAAQSLPSQVKSSI